MKQKWEIISKRARLELARLNSELEKCKSLIAYHGKELQRKEEIASFQVKFAVGGQHIADYFLPQSLQGLEGGKVQLAAYEKYKTDLEAKIDALAHPTAAQLAERAKWQSVLEKVANERLEKDRRADRVLQELRRLLGERAELSAKMAEVATSADFTFSDDCLDELRFKTLSSVLPAELAATSEVRAADLFAEEREK